MFELTKEEFGLLRSQIVTSNPAGTGKIQEARENRINEHYHE